MLIFLAFAIGYISYGKIIAGIIITCTAMYADLASVKALKDIKRYLVFCLQLKVLYSAKRVFVASLQYISSKHQTVIGHITQVS